MLEVRIYGFPSCNVEETIVQIFDNETFGTSNAISLFRGNPDKEGNVYCKIPLESSGTKIRLVGITKTYVEVAEIIDATRIGVYHSVKLKEQSNSDKWNTRNDSRLLYVKAQEQMKKDYRNARYKNDGAVGLYIVLLLLSLGLGYFISPALGVSISIIVIIVTHIIGKYASGHEEGI